MEKYLVRIGEGLYFYEIEADSLKEAKEKANARRIDNQKVDWVRKMIKNTLKNRIKLWWHCLIHHHSRGIFAADGEIFCMNCEYGGTK